MKAKKGRIIAFLAAAVVFSTLNGERVQADKVSISSGIPEGVVLNYHDMKDWDTSFADEALSDIAHNYGVLPESYSSSSKLLEEIAVDSKKDYVTEAKFQIGGTCWAHTATSMAETSYIMNNGITDTINSDSINFNEYHLVHYSYHSPSDPLGLFGGDKSQNNSGLEVLDAGGNVENALCNYANWIGASDITDISADNVSESHSDEMAFDDVAHLENGYILSMPDMTSNSYINDMNVIKQMIMEYGAVSVSYYAADAPYYSNGYQYCDVNASTNHAVTIVGWDDSVSASSFERTPAGNGAWLVKNSWGTGWGLNGYFWLSYYDATIDGVAVAFDFTKANNYDNNYQYDGTGNVWGATSGYMNETVGANAFVADSPESLEAIGFYTYYNNMDYEIRVYRNLEANELPQNGDLVLTLEGSESFAGFHTIELEESVLLKENERYAIVISWKKEGSPVYIPADETYNYGWISFKSYAKAGQSYWGYSIETLSDLNSGNTTYADGVNIRIKAFTNEFEVVNVSSVSFSKDTVSLSSGEQIQLEAKVLPENATYQKLTFSSSNTELVVVDENGIVTANSKGKAGTATITATSEDGKITASCKVVVEPVFVTKLSLNKEKCTLKQGEYITLTTSIEPEIATNKKVSWSSSDSKIATVNQNGKITAIEIGTVTITATAQDGSGKSGSCVVEVIEPHIWDSTYTIDVEPTCTETGSKSIHCSHCEATKNIQQIAATGHRWDTGMVTKAPSCTDTGILMKTCISCGGRKTEIIAAKGHSWNSSYTVDKAASCTTEGSKSIHCKNCSVTKDTQTITATGHKWDSGKVTKAASCTVTGTLTKTCTSCKASKTEKIAAKGHSWNSSYTVDKAATYTQTGSKSIHCKNCSVTKDVKTISALKGLAPKHNGVRKYYENGKVKTTLTTLIKDNGAWYYVKKGEVNFKETTLVNYSGSWFYVKNSKVDFTYTGLCQYGGGWWYVKNGKLDFGYTGLCQYGGSWWQVSSGKVNFGYTGLTQYVGSWWYVKTGKLDFGYTGLCQYVGSWWYVKNGKLDFGYTGLCQYGGSWWYVKTGKLDFGYTGLCQYGGSWWYVKAGKLDFGYTGLCKHGGSWYYVQKGILNWNYTGLCKYGSAWYYVQKGVLNWSYTGLCKYGSTCYYVKKGVLDWNYTGYTNYGGARWYVVKGVMKNKA